MGGWQAFFYGVGKISGVSTGTFLRWDGLGWPRMGKRIWRDWRLNTEDGEREPKLVRVNSVEDATWRTWGSFGRQDSESMNGQMGRRDAKKSNGAATVHGGRQDSHGGQALFLALVSRRGGGGESREGRGVRLVLVMLGYGPQSCKVVVDGLLVVALRHSRH